MLIKKILNHVFLVFFFGRTVVRRRYTGVLLLRVHGMTLALELLFTSFELLLLLFTVNLLLLALLLQYLYLF